KKKNGGGRWGGTPSLVKKNRRDRLTGSTWARRTFTCSNMDSATPAAIRPLSEMKINVWTAVLMLMSIPDKMRLINSQKQTCRSAKHTSKAC
ncbi:hypothetical protein PC128_g26469, partial [Phytophthora cactorum]